MTGSKTKEQQYNDLSAKEMMVNQITPGSNVLVTGATGYTGRVLVKKLLDSGLHVRAIARETSDLTPFKQLSVSWIRGDVFDEQTIRSAMEDVQYVFHVAAAFRESKSTEQYYRKVHVKSTQLIV